MATPTRSRSEPRRAARGARCNLAASSAPRCAEMRRLRRRSTASPSSRAVVGACPPEEKQPACREREDKRKSCERARVREDDFMPEEGGGAVAPVFAYVCERA
eukprot:3298080-Pleurochrysis_carterae.AAC.10